ncbi:glutamate--cysteine ligase [Theileria orientalis]|uniref:Glutamate--cysteine ligase n=1 Tax=Theileria orientalis TaxID=68886 RepID=A0A976M669_THEOR|nr:glutamate--cysteine ligase [Theileria orientalis]
MAHHRSGSTIDYDSICKISGMLRQLATLEFVNIYYQNLNRCDPVYLFGDEIEYLVVNLDHSNFKPRLLPIYPHISKFIQNKHHLKFKSNGSSSKQSSGKAVSNPSQNNNHPVKTKAVIDINNYLDDIMFDKSNFQPEASSYIIESIPDHPYSLFSSYISSVRKSVHDRRKRLELILLMLGYNHSKVTTLTNFSRYGCNDYVYCGDSEFQKVFIENLDPRYIPYFDITITPSNRMYDLVVLDMLRREGPKTYISRYREGFEESLEKDVDSSVNEVLVDDRRGVPVSPRIVDTFNNYKLFPLLSTHNQALCQHLLNTYTPSGQPTTLTDTNENADNGLLNYIMGRVYLYDPKTDHSVNDFNGSNVSNLSKAINVMSVKDTTGVRDNTIAVESVGALCSLQVTFSCCNLDEARYLYDQLLVLSPIFLSLSSATVGYNGILSNYDNRWTIMTALWNDDPNMVYRRRFSKFDESVEAEPEGTVADTNNSPSRGGINSYFSKGRCSTSSLFISNSKFCIDNYKYLNDIKVDCDFDSFVHMTKMGVDPILARHISHNFVKEPLTVIDEDFSQVNCEVSDSHYQIFHDTNWNSVRLNHPIVPPPVDNTDSDSNKGSSRRENNTFKNNRNYNNKTDYVYKVDTSRSNAGRGTGVSEIVDVKPRRTLPWRVEFRPLDIQLTDEENSMFICVVSYVVKVLLLKRLNLYMPISLVDINTEVSSKIESCHRDLFYFRENVTNNKLSVKKFSLHDILFGQVGLFKIVMDHLEKELNSGDVSKEFRDQLVKYLKHFEQLTLGNAPTNATKLRRFIQTHPTYSGDGTISDQILYDIIQNLTSY